MRVSQILDRLERFHGLQEPCWPTDPYLFIVWWHCGYPASDAACAKGWDVLTREIGTDPEQLQGAAHAKLAAALKPGGMVPELRAMRMKEIAARAADLKAALDGPMDKLRKTLKSFPNIADPGADRILLFAGIAPVAAVPSNCPHVLVRIVRGRERENYGVNYKFAQEAIEGGVAEEAQARQRAYLLLKRHGQEICKRTKPKCVDCPVADVCAFVGGSKRVD